MCVSVFICACTRVTVLGKGKGERHSFREGEGGASLFYGREREKNGMCWYGGRWPVPGNVGDDNADWQVTGRREESVCLLDSL